MLSETVAASRLTTVLLSSFAALALVLAAVGIYGVISYTVSQRTREMGIRMTLGARPSDVLRLVIRQGLTMTAIGTAGGLLVAVVLSRILSGMLFEVSGTDPLVLSSVTVGAIVVATLACYVPARRATRADPVQALRNE